MSPPQIRANQQEHLDRVWSNLQIARDIAKENMHQAQQRYKHQYDKNTAPPTYKLQDNVWLYCQKTTPGLSPKLSKKWLGPYYIVDVGDNHTYKLRRCNDHRPVKSRIHANRLKPALDPDDRPTLVPQDPQVDVDLNPEEMDNNHGETLSPRTDNERVHNAKTMSPDEQGRAVQGPSHEKKASANENGKSTPGQSRRTTPPTDGKTMKLRD